MPTVDEYLTKRAQTPDSPLAALVRLPRGEQQRLGVTHTPREIQQQPWAWRETARVVFAQAGALRPFLRGVTHVVFAGAGSSAYAGLALAPLFRQRRKLAVLDVPTTDLLLDPAGVVVGDPNRSLLVSLARSGDSPESSAAVDIMLREFPAVRHLILCCNAQGALARNYRGRPNIHTITLPGPTNDQSLVMTSSYSSLVVAGQCIAELDRADEYLAMLEKLATAAEDLLDRSRVAEEVAATSPARVCLLAPRVLSGMAREGALKLMEITAGRVIAIAETFLGLRHGPMAFLTPQTVILYFFSSNPLVRRYELDLAREVRAKDLALSSVALGPEHEAQAKYSLATAYRDPVPDVFRAPLDVVFPQMLALFLCIRLGLRPDEPSEAGVIHRVVQGVRIYS